MFCSMLFFSKPVNKQSAVIAFSGIISWLACAISTVAKASNWFIMAVTVE